MSNIIYLAQSPSKKVYVGVTSQTLIARKAKHISDALRGSNLAFHRALRKYGPATFKWTLIKVVESYDLALELERVFIAHYFSFKRGYNETQGGEGSLGRVCKESTKSRIGAANRGREVSDITKKKLSIAGRGLKRSEETRAKIASSKLGNKNTLGLRLTEEQKRQRALSVGGRAFKTFCPKGSVIGIFVNMSEVARMIDVAPSNVRACLIGRQKTAKGYRFEYC